MVTKFAVPPSTSTSRLSPMLDWLQHSSARSAQWRWTTSKSRVGRSIKPNISTHYHNYRSGAGTPASLRCFLFGKSDKHDVHPESDRRINLSLICHPICHKLTHWLPVFTHKKWQWWNRKGKNAGCAYARTHVSTYHKYMYDIGMFVASAFCFR